MFDFPGAKVYKLPNRGLEGFRLARAAGCLLTLGLAATGQRVLAEYGGDPIGAWLYAAAVVVLLVIESQRPSRMRASSTSHARFPRRAVLLAVGALAAQFAALQLEEGSRPLIPLAACCWVG